MTRSDAWHVLVWIISAWVVAAVLMRVLVWVVGV